MGRKKRGSANSASKTRRNAKGKTAAAPPRTPPETNTTNSGVTSQECSENESQDSNSLTNASITSAGRKNFGKYRCLIPQSNVLCNNEHVIVNNVEVKIIDPCASSESDNSNSVDILNSVNRFNSGDSPSIRSFSKISRSDPSSNSGSPVSFKSLKVKLMEKTNSELKIENENNITLSDISYDTQLPDPTLNLIACNDPRRGFKPSLNNYSNILETFSPVFKADVDSNDAVDGFSNNYEREEIVDPNSQEYIEKISNGEEEMFTVFEIVDDSYVESSENHYYNSKSSPNIFSSPDSTFSDNSNDNNLMLSKPGTSFSHMEISSEKSCSKDISKEVYDFESKINDIKLSSEPDSCDISENVSVKCADNSNDINDETTNTCLINPESIETLTISKERKNDETVINSESCSTPTSMVSEEDTQIPNKIDNELVSSEKHDLPSNYSTDSSSSSSVSGIRRSSRIKTINVMKQRSKGHGLVKSPLKSSVSSLVKDAVTKNFEINNDYITKPSLDKSNVSMSVTTPLSSPIFPMPIKDNENKPVKVKSRWRRSSEMEMGSRSPITPPLSSPNTLNAHCNSKPSENSNDTNCHISNDSSNQDSGKSIKDLDEQAIQQRLAQFQTIFENDYHCDRAISKEAKKMTCDCFLTKEEMERGEMGCGEDCLNRLLMIECNSRCPIGDRCTNRRFQSHQYSSLRVIKTEKKGLGIEAVTDIYSGEFLMEYVGEVLNWEQFNQRAQEYSSDKNTHHYFMSLKGDAVIDATLKGNISRFINHSCDPNAETQKWTVNGDLRIGFFSKKSIKAGEEITFDYQFQRYGKEGLKCYCEANNCRGWIGEEPEDSSEEEEEEEEEDETDIDKTDTPAEIQVQNETEDKEILEVDPIVDSEKVQTTDSTEKERKVRIRRPKQSSFVKCKNDLRQDMDLEEEMNHLHHTGIKNQSHTLSLCRAMVRAKQIDAKISLLRLLASADLPCRRLFLDYRGLRLLAPWCEEANDYIRLKILIALEKLPITNKTILKESKILSIVDKWLLESSPKHDSSDESTPGSPVFIDESTGLPIENPMKINKTDNSNLTHVSEENIHIKKIRSFEQEKIYTLSKQLLEQWSGLQEIFKIPKKERIQLMKEHERQANELQSITDKEKEKPKEERWEERYNRHDREKKRPILSIADLPRRNTIRIDDRVLAAIPSISKEERRREFAARAAQLELFRRVQTTQALPNVPADPISVNNPIPLTSGSGWNTNLDQNMYSNMMVNGSHGITGTEYVAPDYIQPEYTQTDYTSNEYSQSNNYQYPYCANQAYSVPPNSSMPPPAPGYNFNPNYGTVPYQNSNFVTTPPPSIVPSYQNIPLTSNHPQAIGTTLTHPIPSITSPIGNQSIPTVIAMQSTPVQNHTPILNSQPIRSLVPSVASQYSHPTNNMHQNVPPPYVQQPLSVNTFQNQDKHISDTVTISSIQSSYDTNNDVADVAPWTPVRLPSRWRSMKDARGRTYYYHVKFRISQWEPPLYSPTLHEDDDSSNEEQDVSDEEVETKLQNDITDPNYLAMNEKVIEGVNGIFPIRKGKSRKNGIKRKMQYFTPKVKKARPGLVTEKIISPRLEEDKINAKLDLKRYKENKEKLRKRKELALLTASSSKYKKKAKSSKQKKPEETQSEDDKKAAHKIKEVFRASMARVIVHHLNPYRKSDCQIGRITNNEDFKHLARKLTHFVMLKELKHCKTVNELECNHSVKQKAKEFVRSYMSKFGTVYEKPPDEKDYYF